MGITVDSSLAFVAIRPSAGRTQAKNIELIERGKSLKTTTTTTTKKKKTKEIYIYIYAFFIVADMDGVNWIRQIK